ncbi:MAG TPA: single-stranded DNA-binding protein [Actinomycetes bacterium]|nr:single-stranded DNA-binding protein [Actinomycetes bacterium]
MEAAVARRPLHRDVAESLGKGHRAVVLGRLRTRTWEMQEGEKRTSTEIDADEVAPSLRWAIAQPERADRARSAERAAALTAGRASPHSTRSVSRGMRFAASLPGGALLRPYGRSVAADQPTVILPCIQAWIAQKYDGVVPDGAVTGTVMDVPGGSHSVSSRASRPDPPPTLMNCAWDSW